MKRDLRNKRVLVFGAGMSGISAAALLLRLGAEPVIYDSNAGLETQTVIEKVRMEAPESGKDPQVIAGDASVSDLGQIDLAVLSPGIPLDIPFVEELKAAGIPILGEISLAYEVGKGRVLAITGTNGKTTTTTLLGEIMKAVFDEVYVVGNIGSPYTRVADRQSENAVTVAEISSFQLETAGDFRPAASAITNITPDHLNRHHTMEEYVRVKELIAANQKDGDVCVLNYEDELLRAFADKVRCEVIFFSSKRVLDKGIYLDGGSIIYSDGKEKTEIVKVKECILLGDHNYENIMTAAAMALYAGADAEVIGRIIREFPGVEHRIEFVTEKDGIRYYNDSKGTNPDAAIKAIQAMDRPTLLIGGGYDKNSSYDEWIGAFGGKVKYLALIGQTREKIRDAALAAGLPAERIVLCEDLKEAVAFCKKNAVSGDAVLLSPACASWGQFRNYEERGDLFKEYVFGE